MQNHSRNSNFSPSQSQPAGASNCPREETQDACEFDYSQGLRQHLAEQGLSSRASEILVESWRTSTLKIYKSIVNQWYYYASSRRIKIFDPPIGEGINFITQLFQEGANYGRLCTIRSALAGFVFITKDFGSNKHVIRLFKGMYNIKPVFPIKSQVAKWDPNKVLSAIENWWPLETLTLKELTLKVTFILAITTGQRVNTLSNILIDNLYFTEDKCTIFFDSLLKTSRRRYQQEPIQLFPYENKKLCIFYLLRHYLEITKDLRKDNQLLISFKKPHRKVTSDSVSRWIKLVLKLANIDVINNSVKAHSTRAMATSIASLSGMPINQIMGAAGWTQESTFVRHYKMTLQNNIGKSVLDSFQKAKVKLYM